MVLVFFFGGFFFLGLDLTGLWSVMAGVVTAGVRMVVTTPDVVGLTVSLCKSVLTSVSVAGTGRGREVVGSGVENIMESTDVPMEAVVVVICAEVSGGGVE